MVETVAAATHSIRYLSRKDMDKCVRAVSDFLPGVMPQGIRTMGSLSEDTSTTTRKAA